jgi:gluconolactonase
MNITPFYRIFLSGFILASSCLAQELNPTDKDLPVDPTSLPVLVKDGFTFTEGPELSSKNLLYFTDIPNQTILRYDLNTNETTIFKSNSNRANGLAFLPNGTLLACEMESRRITAIDQDKTQILVDQFQGKPLNQPNDIEIDSKGGFYFTDPYYGKDPTSLQQPHRGVYYAHPNQSQSTLSYTIICINNEFKNPNGLVLSLDQKTLYVVDNGTGEIWSLPLPIFTSSEPMQLIQRTLLTKVNLEGDRIGDGITLDEKGNLYLASGKPYLMIYSPTGKELQRIECPEAPANCTFGPKGTHTLYITARKGLYRLTTRFDGRSTN